MMSNVPALVGSVFASVFRARPSEPILEWAEKEIELSTEESGDFPGRYDASLNPLPTILFEVYQSGNWTEAWFKKSSQSGVTLVVLIFLTWFRTFVRRNFMYVLDSRDEMKKVSKARLQPMMKKTGGGEAVLSEDPDDMTSLTMFFRGFVGYLMGAQSEGAMANKSVAVAVCDEVDTYPEPVAETRENAVDLVRDRLKKQMKGFFIGLSKPRNWEDKTNQEYLTGSRHKCFVPCPHCGHFQELIFENVIFAHCKLPDGAYELGKVRADTFYQCAAADCSLPIYEHHKPLMIERREWRKTNLGQDKWKPVPKKFSCEITDLYSTFPKTSWGALAVEWLDAQGDLNKLKRFKRGRLAQAWEDRKPEVGENDIFRLLSSFSYQQGHCPFAPDLVTFCSDRQEDVYKWVKVAWRFDAVDDCAVVDYGECGSFDDLLLAADVPVIVDHWGDVPEAERVNPVALFGLIDEGHQTFQIRKNCLSTARVVTHAGGQQILLRFHPVKGRGGMQVRDLIWETEAHTEDGLPIKVYHISDDDFRSQLYEEAINGRYRVLSAREKGVPALAPLLHLFQNPDPRFVSELCQERRKPAIVRNKHVLIWDKPKGANDFGDALKYNLAACASVRQMFPRRRLTTAPAS